MLIMICMCHLSTGGMGTNVLARLAKLFCRFVLSYQKAQTVQIMHQRNTDLSQK